MKIFTTQTVSSKSKSKEVPEKKVLKKKDYRDLENSLTDWNAENNQSGRHK